METSTSEAERQRPVGLGGDGSQPRAMSVEAFCRRYGIGRTSAYEEIKQRRLRAVKAGKRTLILEDDAEDWLSRLPILKTEPKS